MYEYDCCIGSEILLGALLVAWSLVVMRPVFLYCFLLRELLLLCCQLSSADRTATIRTNTSGVQYTAVQQSKCKYQRVTSTKVVVCILRKCNPIYDGQKGSSIRINAYVSRSHRKQQKFTSGYNYESAAGSTYSYAISSSSSSVTLYWILSEGL